MDNEMMLENYCDDCDDVLNVVVNAKDFYDFKVGRIRCKCGCVVKPCNECLDENGQHYNCSKCPWEKAKIVHPMTDEEHIRWVRDNEPKLYKLFLEGKMGDHYKEVIAKIEQEDSEASIKIMKSFGYVLYDVTEYGIFFRDKNFKATKGVESLLKFKDWKAVKRYADEISK